jgi:hypothetical protein
MSATPTAPAAAPAPSGASASPAPSAPSAVTASNAPAAPKTTEPTNPKGLPPGDMPQASTSRQAAGADAPTADAAARAEEVRKFKLKVNGREREVDEAEVIRRAQLADAADERFKEAAQMRKQTEAFLEALRADPISVLQHPELGIDFRGLSEQYLTKELQRELMSPEQRELEELREFRKAAEARTQAEQQEQMTQRQQQEHAQLTQRAAVEYDRQITEALSKSDLPKTPYTIKRVVEVMQNALANGYDLDVPTAVDMVREGYHGDVQALVGNLDGEALIKVLGDAIVGKLRKHDLANLRRKLEGQQPAAPAAGATPTPRSPREPRSTEPKKLNTHDWLAQVRAKAGV